MGPFCCKIQSGLFYDRNENINIQIMFAVALCIGAKIFV